MTELDDSTVFRGRKSLLIDLGSTALLCATFLTAFCYIYGGSAESALAHIKVLSCMWVLFSGLKIIVYACSGKKTASSIAPLASFTWLALIATWYALIIIGLHYWGRITTAKVVGIYVHQAPTLASVLGVPLSIFCAALIMAIALLIALAYRLRPTFDWTIEYICNAGKPKAIILAILAIAASCIQLNQMTNTITMTREPFGVSVLPGAASDRFESHQRGGSNAIDALEDKVRKNMPVRSSPKDAVNLIVIVSDALRADHLGAYGYGRNTSPFLDELIHTAASKDVVRNMRASCAESNCGLMSIASSRRVSATPRNPITLMEALKRHGYATHLILSGDHTNFYGLKEAYGTVDFYSDGTTQTTRYVNDDALVVDRIKQLPDLSSGAPPVAMQLHLMSAHGLGLRKPESSRFKPLANYYKDPSLSAERKEVRQAGVNYYDDGVAEVDRTIQAVISILSKKGYLKRTLLVLTADHGEMLGEHGRFSHASQVYEPALNIPFILIRYGYAGNGLAPHIMSSQIDIAPTILTDMGIAPPSSWAGLALQLDKDHENYYFQQGDLSGLYTRRKQGGILKYWTDLKTGIRYFQ